MEGPQLDTPRADAGQNEQVGTSRSILGAGGERGGTGHQERAQGQEDQAEGQRHEEGRAGSTETRALATSQGRLWLGNVVSEPLICLEARQTLTSKDCPWHPAGQAHLSQPRTPGSFPGRSL